ncbi:hypothetical protein Pcaca05_42230 [Pectobacterium carotovorum subsp. carotovorum]|nr:hypothetical protein Pcaca05_42230 [Pectobacterium carotovorum subsp. carotovorum]
MKPIGCPVDSHARVSSTVGKNTASSFSIAERSFTAKERDCNLNCVIACF